MRRIIEILITFFLIAYSLINFLDSEENQDLYILLTSVIVALGYWAFIISKIKALFFNSVNKIRIARKKNKVELKIKFKTIIESQKIINHTLILKRIFSDSNDTHQIYHSSDLVGEYVIDTYEQSHTFEIIDNKLFDVNGMHLLFVKYHTGAHTEAIHCYRLKENHYFEQLEGGVIGSDWPKIEFKYNSNSNNINITSSYRFWKKNKMKKKNESYTIENESLVKL